MWQTLDAIINQSYDMEQTWGSGGKKWTSEYKYRRGGKTLCCLYAKSNCIGFMIIFGKLEREKFEEIRGELPKAVCDQYDAAETYHDGKRVMSAPPEKSFCLTYSIKMGVDLRQCQKLDTLFVL